MTNITQNSRYPLLPYIIDFVYDLPEYPYSGPFGHTYIIPSMGRSRQEIINKYFKIIYYIEYRV
jgi:hypothetical protein